MKERFGIDPQFPLERWSVHEHAEVHEPDLRRVAAERPPRDEVCTLPRRPRSRELVLFAVLGGVPESLATESPSWDAIVRHDPASFDFTGIDMHMIQSTVPRVGLPAPSTVRGDNGIDPVHGREWDTKGDDLQFACTFALPSPKTCSPQDASCDCALAEKNPPLCGATLGEQLRSKAYPSIRPLRVAQALGSRGVIGSICAGGGCDATMKTLATRLAPRLAR